MVIAPRWTQRASVELMQRFDFNITPIMTFRSHTWGDSDKPVYNWTMYGAGEIVTERALATLSDKPDVIVLGWLNTAIIPSEVEQKILNAVANGAGLVIFNPKTMSPEIKALIKTYKSTAPADVYTVVDGIPSSHLPPLAQASRTLIGHGVNFYESGKGGSIAVVNYGQTPISAYAERGNSSNSYLSPPLAGNNNVYDIHYDYYCAFAGRCILWAGRNMPQVKLSSWTDLPKEVWSNAGAVSLGGLHVAGAPEGAVLEIIIRDFDSTIEYQSLNEIAGNEAIDLVVGRLKAGGHYADVILRNATGQVLDWGTHYFTSTTGVVVTSVTTPEKSYQDHGAVPIVVTAEGDLDGADIQVEAYDTHGRLIWSAVTQAGSKVTFDADCSSALTMQCNIRAVLKRGEQVLAAATGRVLLQLPKPDPDQYQYGGWITNGRDFVEKQAAKAMVARGISGGVISGDLDEWAAVNVQPTPYVTRRYPNNGPGETGLMVRKPCLTDPAYLEEDAVKIKSKVAEKMHYSPPVYTLGDDQGMMLTRQDGCISETCLAAFRDYLANQYSTVEMLNTSWGTEYKTFADAMPVSLDDAMASEQYPRWADHRMYMDKLFVDTHVWGKSVVQSVDSDAKVGFEGPLWMTAGTATHGRNCWSTLISWRFTLIHGSSTSCDLLRKLTWHSAHGMGAMVCTRMPMTVGRIRGTCFLMDAIIICFFQGTVVLKPVIPRKQSRRICV